MRTPTLMALLVLSPLPVLATGNHGHPVKPSHDPQVTTTVGVSTNVGVSQRSSNVAKQNQTQGQAQKQGQHQGQSQTAKGGDANQSQNASADNAGNSLSVNNRDRLQAPAISAPAVYASGPCAYGWSAGVAVPGVGVSGGKSKPDTNCDRRELARVMSALNPAAAIKILCTDPLAKEAGLTEEDCTYRDPLASLHTAAEPDEDFATREYVDRVFKQSQSK